MNRPKRPRAGAWLLVGGLATASLFAGLAAPGCVFDWADDCARSHDYPSCQGARVNAGVSSSSSSSGGGDASTSVSSTGTGGSTGCNTDQECSSLTAPPGPCAALGKGTCTNHACVVTYTAGKAPSQRYGSCHTSYCDDQGKVTSQIDPSNFFDDGNACTADTCVNGVAQNTPVLGMACTRMTPSGPMPGVCEMDPDPSNAALITCSECDPTNASDCAGVPGTTCIGGRCVPLSCSNGVKDGNETGTDCGGTQCLPCDKNQGCLMAKDCYSGACSPTNHTCVAPTCSDNVQNESETGVDCGGTCDACADTNPCFAARDCQSGVCVPGSSGDICAAPSCTDGVQNGTETGVDCGGTCPPCWDLDAGP